MIRFLYSLSLLLYAIVSLPRFLKKKRGGAKYSLSFKELFGIGFPKRKENTPLIWIHAVSVGEVKVAGTLIPFFVREYEGCHFLLTCATKTGLERAKTIFPAGTECAILPLDFSFTMKRIVQEVQPDIVLVSESDYWLNFLSECKKSGAFIAMINGKISERSFSRYKKVPRFTRMLFSPFDKVLVQNEEYADRFKALGIQSPVRITGNMKYDVAVTVPHSASKNAITFGSTHVEEEDDLLNVVIELQRKSPTLQIFFVPRHPDRFDAVAEKMETLGLEYGLFSKGSSHPLILVDAMGALMGLYSCSKIGVVCGSFSSRLCGHDIFEPILAGCIPIFGPHMSAQKEMVKYVLSSNAGKQVSIANLVSTICSILEEHEEYKTQMLAGQRLIEKLQGSSQKTWSELKAHVNDEHPKQAPKLTESVL